MGKTLIFDVDGTLLDTEKIYMRAWVEGAARYGFHIPDEALRKTRAVNAKVAAETFKHYCGQDFPYDVIRVDRVEIAERLIGESTVEELLKPRAAQVLQELKGRGYTIAAASSTGYQKTVEHLEHGGLLEYFDVIVGGDMVEKGKPEPDIFLKAAALAKAETAECLVVGDTPADVLAASAAGIRVILIPDQVPANEQTTALSLRVLDALAELPSVID